MNKANKNDSEKGGKNGLGMWVKTMVSSSVHKELKRLAIDEDISLAALLREAIKKHLKQKEKQNAKS